MIEKYYKRVTNGKTIELHLYKEENEKTKAIIYPKLTESKWYQNNEFVEIDSLDEWLDEGLKSKIFNSLQRF